MLMPSSACGGGVFAGAGCGACGACGSCGGVRRAVDPVAVVVAAPAGVDVS